MTPGRGGYTLKPFPRARQITVDGGWLAARKHTVHGLFEVDVTVPRRLIREHKARTGETVSFTAFVLTCLGRAVDADRLLNAYRDWRGRLVLFDSVDVNTMFAVDPGSHQPPVPHIIRAVNTRSLRAIHDEIRGFQGRRDASRESRGIGWFTRLPFIVRRLFYWMVFKNPHWLKKSYGTVSLTAVGMFGDGLGWVIPFGISTLAVSVGGIAELPAVVDGEIVPREILALTVSFDHDVVDGAPAARFAAEFKRLLESGYGLAEIDAGPQGWRNIDPTV